MSARGSSGRLLARLFTSSPAASIAVIVTVLVCTMLAAAAPRALQLLFTQELRHAIAGIGDTQRDLVASGPGAPATGGGDGELPGSLDSVFGAMEAGVESIRDQLGPTVRPLTGAGRYAVTGEAGPAPKDVPGRTDAQFFLTLAIDPRVSEVVRTVTGSAPAEDRVGDAIGVQLSVSTAELMSWPVGDERTVLTPGGPLRVLLAGTFEPVDADDTRWQHVPSILEPSVADDGNLPPRITGTGYLEPSRIDVLEQFGGGLTTTVWFPVDPVSADFADAQAIVAELRSFTSRSHPVSGSVTLGQVPPLTFRDGIVPAIQDVLARSASTTAVVALVAAGPFGVAVAVLALAIRLVVLRRTPGLALAAARGGSPVQIRGILALEGLLLGLPAGAAGIGVAFAIVPGTVSASALAPAVVLAMAPTVLFALPWSGHGGARQDLDTARPAKFRWVAEVIVVALAVSAVVLLLARGLVTAGQQIDPLLVAAPLLLALATSIAVLRLYPVPLAAIGRVLSRRDGVVGPIGAATAVRGAAVPVAPVLAMVVGVSIAVFSSVLVATLDRGALQSAQTLVGADLRVEGAGAGDILDAVRALDGVAAAAPVQDAGPANLRIDSVRDTITLVIVDAASIATVHGEALPLGDDRALVSTDLLDGAREDSSYQIDGDAVLVTPADPSTGLVTDRRWAIVDAGTASSVLGLTFRPDVLLLALDPGADPDQVSAAVSALTERTLRFSTPASELGDLRTSPAISGLRAALVTALVVATALAAFALVLASIAGARARLRVLALLGTLGLSSRQAGGLAAWELVPTAAASVVAGVLLGLALPAVLVRAIDLRPFTGGSAQPPIEVPWLQLGAVVAGFAVLVLLAVLISTAAARRTSAALTLRMGDGPS